MLQHKSNLCILSFNIHLQTSVPLIYLLFKCWPLTCKLQYKNMHILNIFLKGIQNAILSVIIISNILIKLFSYAVWQVLAVQVCHNYCQSDMY